jgi:hypothetical protein
MAPTTAIHPRARLAGLATVAILAAFALSLLTPATEAAAATTVSVSAPAAVSKNSKAKLTVSTAAGEDVSARIWELSTTTGAWRYTGASFTLNDGKGSREVTVTSSRTLRIQTGDGDWSAPVSISARDSSSRAVSARFTATEFASGELSFIRGTTYKGSTKTKGTSVTLQRAKKGSTKWTSITSTKTTSSGTYTFKINPASSNLYRVVLSNSSTRSGPLAISGTSGARTLEERVAEVSAVVGSPQGSAQSISHGDLPSGVNEARYITLAKGTLVEVTTDSSVRTWLVYDKIGSKWSSLDRWDSPLNVPRRDAKCGLLENGCVQRFYGGSIYQNPNKSSTYTAYGSVAETEIIAVARSQNGYIEGTWRKNKFNSWVGGNYAWCSVFMSWSAAASGNSSMIPKRQTFEGYLAELKSEGVLNYSGTPPLGAVVLFDWGSGTPSHTGIVRGHSGSNLLTVEGNTSDGKGSTTRGVHERSRSLSYVWAWYWPHEYAAAS